MAAKHSKKNLNKYKSKDTDEKFILQDILIYIIKTIIIKLDEIMKNN